MIEGPCIFILKPGDRLFASLHSIVFVTSAIAISAATVCGVAAPTKGQAPFVCLAKPFLLVKLPCSTLAFQQWIYEEPPSFHLEIADGTNAPDPGKLSSAARALLFPHFVEFFERHKNWMHQNIHKDRYRWPTELCFASIVRDAISHNNIRIRNKNETVSWGIRTYSAADNDRDPFENGELGLGDLILLMAEMSLRLNDLKCPTF
ncbi:MAG: hypothetical protein QOF14_1340 [Hyphomicrobiales bacterium]|jgi:hypothetical protein|nr:hypothetical protein [Hyphomicrobiales bacterium]